MKYIFIPVIVLSLIVKLPLKAQDSKVTTGIVEYNQQNYVQAFQALNTALQNTAALKEKSIPKAYYYRAKTIMRLYASDPSNPDYDPLNAFADLKAASASDDGSWQKKIDSETLILNSYLMNMGVMWLNSTFKTGSEEAKTQAYSQSLKYFEASKEINSENYMTYDLLGQSHLGLKDSPLALQYFETAIQKYSSNPPSKPDILQAYTYYRASIIHMYYVEDPSMDYFGDLEKALATTRQGEIFLENEWKKIQADDDISPTEKEGLKTKYEAASEDLLRLELSELQQMPGRLPEAIAKFEEAAERFPADYNIHIMLGSLYEQTDEQMAIETYKKAIGIDPNNSIAYFNLGALYNNRAVAIYKEMNSPETDELAYDKLYDQVKTTFRLAMPQFEKVLDLEPGNKDCMRSLMQIYLTLDMEQQYNDMKARFENR